jgi:hypothetical protein
MGRVVMNREGGSAEVKTQKPRSALTGAAFS